MSFSATAALMIFNDLKILYFNSGLLQNDWRYIKPQQLAQGIFSIKR